MFRISEIDAFAIAIPLKMPVKMAGILIETCDNLIVRVKDSAGNIGWGEASSAPTMTGETAEGLVAATKFMAGRLKNKEIVSHNDLHDLIEPLMYGNHSAKSAIDSALHDLIGKHLNKPIYELLGGKKREKSPMFWMVAGSSDEMELVRDRAAEGYIAFKVKAEKVRKIVGEKVRVSADANQGFSLENGLIFAKGAGSAGLDFFEQPVMGHDIDSMKKCADVCSVPLCADEGIHSIADIQKHYDAGAAMGGSLKLIKLGSSSEVMKAGELMQKLSMNINLAGKTADSSIASAAISHLAVSLPTLQWDASVTNQYLVDDVAKNPIKVLNGHIITPDDPGLGIEVDIEKLEKYKRKL
jgi:L-alanine-DL-glutamate epimerase-like enolase superfamily enzyme